MLECLSLAGLHERSILLTDLVTHRGDISCQFLLPGVNFTNILRATFVPKSFCQKITNPNCNHIKAVQKTFVHKKLLVNY